MSTLVTLRCFTLALFSLVLPEDWAVISAFSSRQVSFQPIRADRLHFFPFTRWKPDYPNPDQPDESSGASFPWAKPFLA